MAGAASPMPRGERVQRAIDDFKSAEAVSIAEVFSSCATGAEGIGLAATRRKGECHASS